MNTRIVRPDGSPIPDGACVNIDNYTTTFTVTVRSMRPVSDEALKNIIQQRLEVTKIEATEQVAVTR